VTAGAAGRSETARAPRTSCSAREVTRVRTLGALVAGPLLVISTAVAGMATEGYDPRAETVSRLASPGQPLAMLVATSFVLYGLLVVVGALPLAARFAPGSRCAGPLVAVYGLAGVVCGLAPKDLPGAPPTTASTVHVLATVVGGAAIVGAMAIAGWPSIRPTEQRLARVALVVTLISAVAFRATWGTPVYGAIERVVLGAPLVWLTVVAAGRGPTAGGWSDVGVRSA